MPKTRQITAILQPLSTHPDPEVRRRVGETLRLLAVSESSPGLIPPHGNYRELASYAVAEIAFDCTVAFCKRFIPFKDRTHDQMVQAARSGKQNIAEGCMASGTSKKFELKLVGVARASLEELRIDYEDFLRTRNLPKWDKNHPKAQEVRALSRREDRSYETYETYVKRGTSEVAANTVICLVHQACFLLDRQLRALEQDFLQNGGFTERLYRTRRNYRDGKT